jgi:hybrid cluster-associated redox disulfide protein
LISRKTKISEIVQKHPDLINILIVDYGLHCIGCQMAELETLEQGATVHGMTKKEITAMVEKLNQLKKSSKAKK